MALRSTAHYFLEGLVELGVEHVFANLGTDHAPIIEELARWRQERRRAPRFVLCPHENVAIHMAGGYALATGRGQAVLVHVDVGTGNVAAGMHNLQRYRLPALVMAGKAPATSRGELVGARDSYIHYMQDVRDMPAIVRPYAKWEHSLDAGVVAKELLRRAQAMMESDPAGPVYLSLPREALTAQWEEADVASYPPGKYGPLKAGGADPDTVAALAERLLAAERPILVTAYAGRYREAPALVDELAQLAGIRVFEHNPIHLNIDRTSPCFGGFAPTEALAEADLGLLVDVDVPWVLKDRRENPATFWAQIDVDPIKQDIPLWDFPAEQRIQGSSARVLAQLVAALKARAGEAQRARSHGRIESWARSNAARREAVARAAAERGAKGALSAAYVCAEVGRAIGSDAIVLNEAVRNGGVVQDQVVRTRPGTYVGTGGGGLGFSGGMALGLKLAQPDRDVVQILGDGSFYFTTPLAVYAVAKQYALPIFTVVLDNGGWAAVKASTLRVYPDGAAKEAGEYQSMLARGIDLHKVAEACGAHAEAVDDPEALPAAIGRCLEALRSGRAAVLVARIAAH
ncbi:MAG: thiamine pyrophosphate-requiring protein [Burkholderiales bacterium]|nr:thiamine pyrophosphate-requiring protein [Burkholderiales bacterium]